MTTRSKKPVTMAGEEIAPKERITAMAAITSGYNAAVVVQAYAKPSFGDIGIDHLFDLLQKSTTKIEDGNLKSAEAMLFGQAHALQAIFMNFAGRAANQSSLKNLETFLRLALKAQSQCRATLETLATIKNPPVIYARQANIANGPQQVNNGPDNHARTEEIKPAKNELLEVRNGERLDSGAQGAAIGVDQRVEALGKVDGAAHK